MCCVVFLLGSAQRCSVVLCCTYYELLCLSSQTLGFWFASSTQQRMSKSYAQGRCTIEPSLVCQSYKQTSSSPPALQMPRHRRHYDYHETRGKHHYRPCRRTPVTPSSLRTLGFLRLLRTLTHIRLSLNGYDGIFSISHSLRQSHIIALGFPYTRVVKVWKYLLVPLTCLHNGPTT